MPPTAHVAWAEFGAKYHKSGSKGWRVDCKHCGKDVVALIGRLRQHLLKCPKRDQGDARQPLLFHTPSSSSSSNATVLAHQKGETVQRTWKGDGTPGRSEHERCHRQKAAKRQKSNEGREGRSHNIGATAAFAATKTISSQRELSFDRRLARAICCTGIPFNAFEDPLWLDFFGSLMPGYTLPGAARIRGELLQAEYRTVMNDTMVKIKSWSTICLSAGTALSSRRGQQVFKLEACGPEPYFLKHLRVRQHNGLADSLLPQLVEVKTQLLEAIGEVKAHRPRILWSFVSDSPAVVRQMRQSPPEDKPFVIVYGCASQNLNDVVVDILKLPEPFRSLKEAISVTRHIEETSPLQDLLRRICQEELGKPISLALFTRTRWATSVRMFERLNRVRPAATRLSSRSACDGSLLKTDVELVETVKQLLEDERFWQRCSAMEALLGPISSCTHYLEQEGTTLSSVYACFLYCKIHLATLDKQVRKNLSLEEPEAVEDIYALLDKRLAGIYSPLHALAFYTDPFFFEMRKAVETRFGHSFLELGQGPLMEQCHKALKLLSDSFDENYTKLIGEFASFCIKAHHLTHPLLANMRLQPALAWSTVQHEYRALAPLLIQIHLNPASVAREESRKTSRTAEEQQAYFQHVNHLGPEEIDQITAIRYNVPRLECSVKYEREMGRGDFLERLVKKSTELEGDGSTRPGLSADLQTEGSFSGTPRDDSEGEEDEDELLRFADFADLPDEPSKITERMLFTRLT